jgi:hypothetical protein
VSYPTALLWLRKVRAVMAEGGIGSSGSATGERVADESSVVSQGGAAGLGSSRRCPGNVAASATDARRIAKWARMRIFR